MHYFREMILLFYIVSIAMGVAGLTCCVLPILPNLRKKPSLENIWPCL